MDDHLGILEVHGLSNFHVMCVDPQRQVGDGGGSGALVVGPDSRAVGLYWGSGSTAPGDPLVYRVASPIDVVADQLGIRI